MAHKTWFDTQEQVESFDSFWVIVFANLKNAVLRKTR